jgi:hypothetical protein
MKSEKYYRDLFKKEHDSLIGIGENIQNVMTEDRFIRVMQQLNLCGVVGQSVQLCLGCDKNPAVTGYDLWFCEDCWENADD